MKLVAENEYLKVLLDEGRNLLCDEWKPEANNIKSDEEFKLSLMLLKEVGLKHSCRLLLTNATHLNFPVAPSVQEWLVVNIIQPLIEKGLSKQAFVMPTDLFAQVGIGQYSDEATEAHNQFTIRHFDNLEKANHWLLA
jgi:hypothetical protein